VVLARNAMNARTIRLASTSNVLNQTNLMELCHMYGLQLKIKHINCANDAACFT